MWMKVCDGQMCHKSVSCNSGDWREACIIVSLSTASARRSLLLWCFRAPLCEVHICRCYQVFFFFFTMSKMSGWNVTLFWQFWQCLTHFTPLALEQIKAARLCDINYGIATLGGQKYVFMRRNSADFGLFSAPPLAFITAWIRWGVDLTNDKLYSSSICLHLSLIVVRSALQVGDLSSLFSIPPQIFS